MSDRYHATVTARENGPYGALTEGMTLVEQKLGPDFPVVRARPLCEWPKWPHYKGGDAKSAASSLARK